MKDFFKAAFRAFSIYFMINGLIQIIYSLFTITYILISRSGDVSIYLVNIIYGTIPVIIGFILWKASDFIAGKIIDHENQKLEISLKFEQILEIGIILIALISIFNGSKTVLMTPLAFLYNLFADPLKIQKAAIFNINSMLLAITNLGIGILMIGYRKDIVRLFRPRGE